MSEHDAVIDTQLDAVDEALRSGTAAAPGDAERELQEPVSYTHLTLPTTPYV